MDDAERLAYGGAAGSATVRAKYAPGGAGGSGRGLDRTRRWSGGARGSIATRASRVFPVGLPTSRADAAAAFVAQTTDLTRPRRFMLSPYATRHHPSPSIACAVKPNPSPAAPPAPPSLCSSLYSLLFLACAQLLCARARSDARSLALAACDHSLSCVHASTHTRAGPRAGDASSTSFSQRPSRPPCLRRRSSSSFWRTTCRNSRAGTRSTSYLTVRSCAVEWDTAAALSLAMAYILCLDLLKHASLSLVCLCAPSDALLPALPFPCTRARRYLVCVCTPCTPSGAVLAVRSLTSHAHAHASLSGLFLLDICLIFRTSVPNRLLGIRVTSPVRVAQIYLRGWYAQCTPGLSRRTCYKHAQCAHTRAALVSCTLHRQSAHCHSPVHCVDARVRVCVRPCFSLHTTQVCLRPALLRPAAGLLARGGHVVRGGGLAVAASARVQGPPADPYGQNGRRARRGRQRGRRRGRRQRQWRRHR